MFLYVVKLGAVLGISGGLLTVKYPDKSEEAFPKNTIEGIIGFEGSASKYYFQALSKVIVNDFAFNGRNRRPAVDPFNCMLNLG